MQDERTLAATLQGNTRQKGRKSNPCGTDLVSTPLNTTEILKYGKERSVTIRQFHNQTFINACSE